MTGTELAAAIAVKIYQVNRVLLTMNEQLERILPHAELPEVNRRVTEMAQSMTRRRTLIEVWEMATGKVWLPGEQEPEG